MSNDRQNIAVRLKAFLVSARFLRPFLGLAAGSLTGFLYFYFVGCKTGTCPITSNPASSIIFGALLGFLTGTSSKKE